MLNIQHNPGLIISGILHILMLVVPISFAVVQQYNEVELFIMTEEASALQSRHIKKREKTEEVRQKIIKEIPPVVKPQMTKENIQVEEETRIEPVAVSEKVQEEEKKSIEPMATTEKIAVTALPLETANPPSSAVQEDSPAPQTTLSAKPLATKSVEFGSATGPKFLHKGLPVYPLIAKKLGKEGRVVLRLTIDAAGNLLNVEVIENTGYGFTEAAIEAVRKSSFLPAKKHGKPILSRAELPIRFKLRRD